MQKNFLRYHTPDTIRDRITSDYIKASRLQMNNSSKKMSIQMMINTR